MELGRVLGMERWRGKGARVGVSECMSEINSNNIVDK